MPEARLEDSGSGLAPASDGWFIVNVREAEWWVSETFGSGTVFQSESVDFPQVGINISVLEPGKPNCLYHSENLQEAFLVLSGRCKLLVEEEERELGPWDFFQCPEGTNHVFVGAGDDYSAGAIHTRQRNSGERVTAGLSDAGKAVAVQIFAKAPGGGEAPLASTGAAQSKETGI